MPGRPECRTGQVHSKEEDEYFLKHLWEVFHSLVKIKIMTAYSPYLISPSPSFHSHYNCPFSSLSGRSLRAASRSPDSAGLCGPRPRPRPRPRPPALAPAPGCNAAPKLVPRARAPGLDGATEAAARSSSSRLVL
ncbi:hypothetical protein HJG60_008843 [Phyllostomus discolor]|uniref:Uncharacterized protein n=1 Tax=Phyllostomus discolor TaxID=89673 RepID=A0A833YSN0_9CHIR|nr:hypothetical protein HJG60_008843 [Phyllostomus discolor]